MIVHKAQKGGTTHYSVSGFVFISLSCSALEKKMLVALKFYGPPGAIVTRPSSKITIPLQGLFFRVWGHDWTWLWHVYSSFFLEGKKSQSIRKSFKRPHHTFGFQMKFGASLWWLQISPQDVISFITATITAIDIKSLCILEMSQAV